MNRGLPNNIDAEKLGVEGIDPTHVYVVDYIECEVYGPISEDLIKEALKEAVFNGVFNLRYIDKILYKWGKDGIKTVKDVEERRTKHNSKKDDSEIDMDIVDWNWFDEE